MKKQSLQLNILLTPENRKLLDEINEKTGIKDQPIMQAMLTALANLWTVTGQLSLPLRFEERRDALLPATPEQLEQFKRWLATIQEIGNMGAGLQVTPQRKGKGA